MCFSIKFRSGDEKSLVTEYLLNKNERLLKSESLNPYMLTQENVLAVHYAERGAQGEGGAVKILYFSQGSLQILYGNYVFGDLNHDALISKLPMLKAFDSLARLKDPCSFNENIDTADNWSYMYMGALNHFLVRQKLGDEAHDFIKVLLKNGGYTWDVFDAVAWFCGANTDF